MIHPKLPLLPPRSSAPGTSFSLVDFAGSGRLAPPFQASVFVVSRGAVSKTDVHRVREMWFVAEGEGSLSYDGRDYAIRARDVLLFDSENEHRVVATGQGDLTILSVWWNQGDQPMSPESPVA